MKQSKDGPAPMSLGEQLQELRKARKGSPSIRRVAEETKISNAYLSQLERDVGGNPSPHVLYRLAEYYEVPYESLMATAGYVKPQSGGRPGAPSSLEILLKSAKLSAAEEEQVKKFIQFLRTK